MQELYISAFKKIGLGVAVTVVFALIYLMVNLKSIIETLSWFKAWWNKHIVDKVIYRHFYKIRKSLNSALSDHKFLNWQVDVMKKIYFPDSDEPSASDDFTLCHISLAWSDLHKKRKDHEYEAAVWKVKEPINHPFSGIWDKSNLTLMTKDRKVCVEGASVEYLYTAKHWKKGKYIASWRPLNHNELHMIREYDRIVGQTVHFPDKIGYMLDNLNLSGKKTEDDVVACRNAFSLKVSAKVDYYYSNVLQSHILEYENYLFYKKCIRQNLKAEKMSREELLNYLPLRRKIHDACDSSIRAPLFSGNGRASLMSVQIMVLVKKKTVGYDCLRIRRSENVVAKAGFIQFIPSGGFEAFNDGDDIDVQRSNYSINKVLFRELGEECFGMPESPEFSRRSSEDIYNQPGISDILALLATPYGDPSDSRKMAEYQFVGITQGLVSLRPEFCFLLVIHDPGIAAKIVCNSETNKMISLVGIRKMEMAETWPDNDLANLNATSAALWELCRETSLYKRCLEEYE